MKNSFPTQEGLVVSNQSEKITLIHKLAFWLRDFLDNAE